MNTSRLDDLADLKNVNLTHNLILTLASETISVAKLFPIMYPVHTVSPRS